MGDRPWTESEGEDAKKMRQQGCSAGVIAEKLNRSRNSVIGKLHRMGIFGGKKQPTARLPRKGGAKVGALASAVLAAQRSEPKFKAVRFKSAPDHVAPLNKQLWELNSDECKWPYGDGPFLFCGHPIRDGFPYCPGHCRIAYEPKIRRPVYAPNVIKRAA